MKKMTPKVLFFLLFTFSMFSFGANAQNQEKKVAIKDWLIANKNNITLVSSKEYQQMSPSVRTLLDKDKQTLVYNQEVTQEDLDLFEQKNKDGDYVSFETIYKRSVATKAAKSTLEIEKDEKYKLSKWLELNKKRNIKIISRQDYESRSTEERAYIDNLKDKIIYEGTAVTLKEVETFEQGKL
jgi:uncharacterized membrane protein